MSEREILEETYSGLMTVIGFKDVTDIETRTVEVELFSDIPCALSQIKNRVVTTDVNSQNNYQAKLFTNPDIHIPAGSKVKINQDEMDYVFEHSTDPFKYSSHQEILIERLEYV